MIRVSYIMASIRDNFLGEAIDGIKSQTLDEWELIIVDGAERNLKFNDNRIKVINEVLPPQMAYNRARSFCNSDIILSCADDDIDFPNRAEVCYGKINSGIDVYVGSFETMTEEKNPGRQVIASEFDYKKIREFNCEICLGVSAYRNSVTPFYDDGLCLLADFYFFAECYFKGLKIKTSEDILSRIRNWSGSVSTKKNKTHHERMAWWTERNRVTRMIKDLEEKNGYINR